MNTFNRCIYSVLSTKTTLAQLKAYMDELCRFQAK